MQTISTVTVSEALHALVRTAEQASLPMGVAARVADVNKVLRLAGYTERLQAGRGYYYWREGNGLQWESVYVYRAADLTLHQWLQEAARNVYTQGRAA